MKKSSDSLRYERKYIIPFSYKSIIPEFLITSKLRFTPQYQDRIVNSIYFDTANLQFFYDNINGFNKRRKFRIRWYGDPNFIKKPVLEVKIKNVNLGKKLIFPVEYNQKSNFQFDIPNINEIIEKLKIPQNLSETLKYLNPILFVSYNRKYFKSKLLECRLTVDSEIEYKSINIRTHSFQKLHNNKNLIMELKYPSNLDLRKLSLLLNFPIRITKSSKYIEGIKLMHSY